MIFTGTSLIQGTVDMDRHNWKSRDCSGGFRNLKGYISGVHLQKCSRFSIIFFKFTPRVVGRGRRGRHMPPKYLTIQGGPKKSKPT